MPLDTQNGQSIANLYDNFVGDTAQAASATHSLMEGYQAFQSTLEGQQLSVSGVSLDEEAVKMMTYQRAYQASARFIKTLSDLLETLVNL
jgi:flagellar hook-associated protein 1 FlgK